MPLHLRATGARPYKWWSEQRLSGPIHLLLLAGYLFGVVSGLMMALPVRPIQVAASVPGEPMWAKTTVDAPAASGFSGATTDSDGNVYAFGMINSGIFDFGDGVLAQGVYSGTNAALVKYSPNGGVVWAKSPSPAPAASRFYDADTDAAGNIYAVGYITGTGIYEFGVDVSAAGAFSGKNTIVVKYTPDGEAVWARTTASSAGISELNSVTVDAAGNIYGAGNIYTTSIFDFGNSITVSGSYSNKNALLIKYGSDGVPVWAKSITTAPNISAFTSVVASSSYLYVTGTVTGTGSYDLGNSVTLNGGYASNNGFVAKYSLNGSAIWARAASTSPNALNLNEATFDSAGNIYIAGTFTGTDTYDLGNGVTFSGPYSSSNTIIAKYSGSGEAQWASTATTALATASFSSIAIDSQNHLYVAGNINGTAQFDFGNSVTVSGSHTSLNIALVQYSADGVALSAKTVTSGAANSYFTGVGLDEEGNVFAAGTLMGTSSFDLGNSISIQPAYSGSAFIAAYGTRVTNEPPVEEGDTTPPVFQSHTYSAAVTSLINVPANEILTVSPLTVKTKPTDDVGVARVDYYLDNVLVGTDNTADSEGLYESSLDLSAVENKQDGLALKAIAYDLSNNTAEHTVTVKPDPWFFPYDWTTQVDIYPPTFRDANLLGPNGTGDGSMFIVSTTDNKGVSLALLTLGTGAETQMIKFQTTTLSVSHRIRDIFRAEVTLPKNQLVVPYQVRIFDDTHIATKSGTISIVDNDGPTVSSIKPESLTTGDAANMKVEASDNFIVSSLVAYFNGNDGVALKNSRFDLTPPTDSIEPITVNIRARDNFGNQSDTAFVLPVTDNDKPLITQFTSPTEITETDRRISVTATDNIGVVEASITFDGLVWLEMEGEGSSYYYDFEASDLAPGSEKRYSIRVTDAAGNFATTEEVFSYITAVEEPQSSTGFGAAIARTYQKMAETFTQVGGMTAEVIEQTPPPVAHSFPYLLYAVLGIFAWRLAVAAGDEAAQSAKVLEIVRLQKVIADDKENFIALASHYLRTPLTLLKGGFDSIAATEETRSKLLEAIAAIEIEVKRILNSIEHNKYLANIKEPEIKREKLRALASLLIWLPLVLVGALAFLANYLFINLQVIEPQTINLVVQVVAFVAVAQFFFSVYRRKYTEKQNLDNLEKAMKYEQRMDEARNLFIEQITANLSDRLDRLNAVVKKIKGKSADPLREGQARFRVLLANFTLLREVRSGSSVKARSTFAAASVLRKVLQQKSKQVQSKGLTIAKNGTLGSIHQNEELVRFILSTVIDNAIKFSPQNGTIQIDLNGNKGMAKFVIRDNGTGISKEGMMHLFKPFTRASSAMHFDYEGFGLSLYLAKIVAEHMAGDIQVQSQPNKGTSVTVIFEM